MRKTREKLFVKKSPDTLHSKGILIRLTEQEKAQIQKSANVRKLATSEFVRRAALGRKADVDYETDTVMALIALTRSVRELGCCRFQRHFVKVVDETGDCKWQREGNSAGSSRLKQ